MKLYVGNLPFKTTESAIRAHFEPFGTVTEAAIVLEKGTGRSRGFGFVTMETAEAGQAAIAGTHDKPFEDRNLIVNEARAREERPERPDRPRSDRPYGGGGGGGRRDFQRRDNRGGGGGGGRDRRDNRRDYR